MSKPASNLFPLTDLVTACLTGLLLEFFFVNFAFAQTAMQLHTETVSGKEIYDYYCYQCHAYSGDANTLASTYLQPKPRNFTVLGKNDRSRKSMLETVMHGHSGTAMMPFNRVLDEQKIGAVVDYIRDSFMNSEVHRQRYHTDANGWPQHERYAVAFPFVNGDIPLNMPWDKLTKPQIAGKRLYMNACISCHDHAKTVSDKLIWEPQAVSYPRNHYSHRQDKVDAISGATTFSRHEQAIAETGLSAKGRRGRRLYLDNCAFCHAPDGSAKNWIGSFLDPRPRDFTAEHFIADSAEMYLRKIILEGLPGTSMPAWKQVLTPSQVADIVVFLKSAFAADRSEKLHEKEHPCCDDR